MALVTVPLSLVFMDTEEEDLPTGKESTPPDNRRDGSSTYGVSRLGRETRCGRVEERALLSFFDLGFGAGLGGSRGVSDSVSELPGVGVRANGFFFAGRTDGLVARPRLVGTSSILVIDCLEVATDDEPGRSLLPETTRERVAAVATGASWRGSEDVSSSVLTISKMS
jgi:hypothetical protein